jgi:hypothetical protein
MGDETSAGSGWLPRVNLVVTIALTVVAGLTKYAADRAEARIQGLEELLKKQELLLKDAQDKRAERESVQKVQLEVYERVVTSLEKKQPELQRVASVLVTNVLDEPLRGGLLQALEVAGAPEVRSEVRRTLVGESRFREDEAVLAHADPAPPAPQGRSFSWEDIDYDVFWCERSGDPAHRIAEAIVAKMRDEGAKGRLRVRLLPDSINARPGYQHAGYVVRLNAGEEKQAAELKRVGDAVLGKAGEFRASYSAQPTPWYLSAFVCPITP